MASHKFKLRICRGCRNPCEKILTCAHCKHVNYCSKVSVHSHC